MSSDYDKGAKQMREQLYPFAHLYKVVGNFKPSAHRQTF